MDTKIEQKMARYVELSAIFSPEEKDIFSEEETSNTGSGDANNFLTMTTGTACVSYMNTNMNNIFQVEGREVYIDGNGYIKARDDKKLSRSELILAKAEIRAELSDNFDEYLELQKDLKKYFKITNKLNN